MTDPERQTGALAGVPMTDWPVVSESVHQVVNDRGERRWIHITVTADEFRPLRTGIEMDLAQLIRAEWP